MSIKFRGGASCWWEFKYAGRTYRIDGGENLHDALVQVFGVRS